MRYSDKFPPNAFLKKHLFDRPWRFLIGIFVYMALLSLVESISHIP